MSNTGKMTQKEKLEIVKYCILNDRNYGDAAIIYSVSYQAPVSTIIAAVDLRS